MTLTTDNLRQSKTALFDTLAKAGATFKGTAIFCPFHDDNNPSGSMYEKNRIWRYKCHTKNCGFSGDIFDVRAKMQNKPVEDILKETNKKPKPAAPPKPKKVYADLDSLAKTIEGVENVFQYTNPDTGRIDMVVVRYVRDAEKYFYQVRPVRGGFEFGGPVKPWPIYNRPRLQAADTIIVVEGEKCVHALHDIDLVATTAPGGAGQAECADWSLLAGKYVYLWPDNDPSGIQHAQDIHKILTQLEPKPEIFWIEPTKLNLPAKGDVVDFIDRLDGGTDKQRAILTVLDEAEPMSIFGGVAKNIESIIAGEQRPVAWPWKKLGKLSQALLPGTITLICGDPGTSKSFMILQAAAYWLDRGIKFAVYELEENRDYHLRRALAQRAEDSSLFDNEWIEQHPDESRAAVELHADFLEGFGRCIFDMPTQQLKYRDVLQWIEDRAQTGCRVIAVDPITAIDTGERCYIEDRKFMIEAKKILQQYDVSLVLAIHPKTGRKTSIGLDVLAGGAAFPRFSQTVLWIEIHKHPKPVTVIDQYQNFNTAVNRTVHICKARNGSGHGLSLGYNFDGASLLFAEQGIIKGDKHIRKDTLDVY